jgi:hypothetical protein
MLRITPLIDGAVPGKFEIYTNGQHQLAHHLSREVSQRSAIEAGQDQEHDAAQNIGPESVSHDHDAAHNSAAVSEDHGHGQEHGAAAESHGMSEGQGMGE